MIIICQVTVVMNMSLADSSTLFGEASIGGAKRSNSEAQASDLSQKRTKFGIGDILEAEKGEAHRPNTFAPWLKAAATSPENNGELTVFIWFVFYCFALSELCSDEQKWCEYSRNNNLWNEETSTRNMYRLLNYKSLENWIKALFFRIRSKTAFVTEGATLDSILYLRCIVLYLIFRAVRQKKHSKLLITLLAIIAILKSSTKLKCIARCKCQFIEWWLIKGNCIAISNYL